VLDVFGGNRRAIEALKAQVEFQQYEVEAVYLTLAANIATTAITEASLRGQIKAIQSIITLEENQLDLIRKQFKIGSITDLDVYAQETALAQARALLPPLETDLAQTRHALAVLIGDYPGNANLPKFKLEDLHLPTDLPVSVPSTLVKQRPDIRAAEALLHQATANIGVATANLLPTFPITGSYGANSDTLSNFFTANNIAWNWQAAVLQTVFNGGALFAQRRAAIAAFEAAFADYQAAVLMGLKNVADSLIALNMDAQELKENAEAEKLAKATLMLVQKQYKIGGANYLQVVNAEMQYQQALINLITSEAARYADTVALFQALGGGWWNRSES
jgi:NodT family efflux transporter outer membrane factor (OMF) lipoprotein